MTKQQNNNFRDITLNKALSALPNSAMPHTLHKDMLEELVRIHKSEDHGISTICLALEVIYHNGSDLEVNDNRTDCVVSVYMTKVMNALEAFATGVKPKASKCEEIVKDGYDFYETVIKDLFPSSGAVSEGDSKV